MMTKKRKGKHSVVEPRALKLADACVHVGNLSKSTLRRAVKRGQLTPSQSSRVWLFEIDELDRWLAAGRIRFDAENGDPQTRALRFEASASAKDGNS